VAPGWRADLVLLADLKDFGVRNVFIAGEEVASGGTYLPEVVRADARSVQGLFQVKDFSAARLRLPLRGSRVRVIDILPGGVLTGHGTAEVHRNSAGEFEGNPDQDIVKVAVVERHKATGNVGLGLLRGYGLRRGAAALSIAHDSHNIIVVGTNDADMEVAVRQLIAQDGGIVLVDQGRTVGAVPLIIGGLMSDRPAQEVCAALDVLQEIAFTELGVNRDVEPVMTLCFMALSVIPALKITDQGLFDVTRFQFVPVEAE